MTVGGLTPTRSRSWVVQRVLVESVVFGSVLVTLAAWGLMGSEQLEAERRLGDDPLGGVGVLAIGLLGVVFALPVGAVLGVVLAVVALTAVAAVSGLHSRGRLRSTLLVLAPALALGSLPVWLTAGLIVSGRWSTSFDADRLVGSLVVGLVFAVPALLRGWSVRRAYLVSRSSSA